MKRLVLVMVFAIFIFFELLAGVMVSWANPSFTDLPLEPEKIALSVKTPVNGTCYSGTVPLSVAVITPSPLVQEESFSCSLDGQALSKQTFEVARGDEKIYSAALEGLMDGLHTLNVFVVGSSSYDKDPSPTVKAEVATVNDSASVTFFVDSSPKINVLSPCTQNYASADVALNFILSKPVEHIGYSLDGKDNVTITGNTTLNGLTSGAHSITVYACDAAGNVGVSETITFTVNTDSEPFFQSSLFLVVIGVIALCLSVSAVGIFYGKKHKTKRASST
jgi:hypothetical protein